MYQDPDKITYFAKTNSRGKETPFGIKRKDRARHMYVIGKTGMGKSTMLENMAIQDIRNGEGMAFIDPHGSTAERLLEYVPEKRIKDVIYFAPFDMDHPIAFNVMEDVGYDKRHLVVSGLITAFKKLWVDAFSARMEYILSNTLLALLEYPEATMLDVNRMLVEKPFRKKVVDNIKDPIVKKFWTEEFANYTDRYTQEATPAIQNKVGQFTSNPLIRNIIGQSKSSFDIRKAMDEKKILIINLSKGRVGEVNASLLGSMLVTKIYLAAMSRADVPASVLTGLPNFYFYVDEFQNFANQSFADILSEARKYKLNLLIAHQYVEQMEEEVRDAVFGNVGTTVAFRVGPFDAEVLETIFQPNFMATDLVNLGFAQVYLTLMIDGVGSPPFSATTLAPFDPAPQNFVREVIAASREQFGRPRADVEEAIALWQAQEPVEQEPQKQRREQYGRSSGNGNRQNGYRTEPRREPRRDERPRRDESQDYRENRFEEPVFETRDMHREEPDAQQRLDEPEQLPPRVPGPRAFGVGEKAEARHGEAQGIKGQITQKRMEGAGYTHPAGQGDAPRPIEKRPPREQPQRRDARESEQHMQPPCPPLEGAQSLRDALMQVSRNTPAQKPQENDKRENDRGEQRSPQQRTEASRGAHGEHAPDLKQVLARMQEKPQEKREPRREERRESPGDKRGNQQGDAPAALPEDLMRAMLAVDDYEEKNG